MARVTELLAGMLGAAGLRRWLLGRALPPEHETLAVGGCREPVRIRIDRWGVPHIQAEHAADLFFAQGYCHARDRLWQLELNRRTARGELAELFGARAVEFDRLLRRFGLRRLAEREASELDAEVRLVLEAYAAGVNAYRDRRRLPIEFQVLRWRPLPWRIVDSLAFARYMGWSMTFGWDSKLIRQRLQEELGAEAAAALEPLPLPRIGGGGSNNWVVAPARSSTGRPILANDPHLRPLLPCAWHLSHLRGAGYNVIGATLPGLPGILIGHNEHVAWGITAAATDGQDLFIERSDSRLAATGASAESPALPPVAAKRGRRFAGPDGCYDAEVSAETIQVRARPSVVDEIVRTRHGPLLNGLLVAADAAPLALQSITDRSPCPAAAILQLDRATDWSSFRAALAGWTFPTLNFVYADVTGTIACKLAGHVPLRRRTDNSLPVPGWTGDHDWSGVVPFDDLPEAVNGADGMYATANSAPFVPCRHFLGNGWLDSFRRQRILELLQARPQHSLADMEGIHNDVVSVPARVLAGRLLERFSRRELPELAYLEGWDGRLDADSVAASIYEVFRHELLRSVGRGLPQQLAGYVHGQSMHERLSLSTVFHGQATSLVLRLLEQSLARERGALQVEDALRCALGWLRVRLGPDARGWHWGRLHRIAFDHVLGRASPTLERLLRLSRGPFAIGGDADTVAQSGIDPWHPFAAATFTVTYRQIIDVGAWDESRVILQTGQSGHPGSAHYDDMLPSWRRGAYVPLWFSEEAIERETSETIRLLPERR